MIVARSCREAVGYVAATSLAKVGGDDWSPARTAAWEAAAKAERVAQAALLHDLIGNPFHSLTPDPAWLNSTVVSLAQVIYDGRRFESLPELARALEEAGCTAVDFLEHCRQPGGHARGCWVVDLLLGKDQSHLERPSPKVSTLAFSSKTRARHQLHY